MLLFTLIGCSDFQVVTKEDNCEPEVYYVDADGDGFGDEVIAACEAPEGTVSIDGDCDDEDPSVHPDAEEVCNGVDDDCEGTVDVGVEGMDTFWWDDDGDGWGGDVVEACDQPEDAVTNDADCDDTDSEVNPIATEVCNGIDDNCDGDIDGDAVDQLTWWLDSDGDGYGDENEWTTSCEQPSNYVGNADDCDDSDGGKALDCSNPPTETTCNGQVYTFSNSTGEPELVILSVYEPTSGTVDVDIQRNSEMVVLLSSYEPVTWTLTNSGGATLNKILVNGYHSQYINAPSGVPTEVRSYDQGTGNFGGSCGYSWPYNGGGCDTNHLVSGVQSYTGLTVTDFTGCYTGSAFVVK